MFTYWNEFMTVRIGRRDVEFGRVKNVLDGVLLTESQQIEVQK